MKYSEDTKEQMKKRLKKIASKKIDTTMIFPLSQFEENFGSLWGHGKPIEALSQEEALNRRKWTEMRTNILNMGNQQKRGLCNEIDMHDIVWLRYQTILTKENRHES